MKRRDFIAALGGAAASPILRPLTARAQQSIGIKRVGVLMGSDEAEFQRRFPPFRDALAQLGWVEPRNLRIDSRWSGQDPERARALARELLALAPDCMFVNPGPVVETMQTLTRTIPVVFTSNTDPVEAGYVQSYAHPGGNITGFTQIDSGVAGKWLQLLRDIVPQLKRVGVLRGTSLARARRDLASVEAAAAPLGVKAIELLVHDESGEIERAIETFARVPNGGLIVVPTNFLLNQSSAIVRSVERHHLPAIYYNRAFADAGGLVSYGVDQLDIFRRAASYVDRILRGAKPSDLPVQTPTKYELVLNLKAAKALGLEIPHEFLLIADEVIE
jgi:putative ABC transport system substrate-binding protein